MMLRLVVRGVGKRADCILARHAARAAAGAAARAHHDGRRHQPLLIGCTAAPFSSVGGGGGGGGGRAFPTEERANEPEFAIWGDDCLVKFRLSNYMNKPRLLLLFTRKAAGGVYDWRGTKRLSMSPEELGLLLDSGPTEELIFKRSGGGMPSSPGGQQGGGGNEPPKEVKFIPTSTGDWIIHLHVDGEVYEVTVTRGRKAVIKSLIHAAIPVLCGWQRLINSIGAEQQAPQHYSFGEQHGGGGGGGGVPF